MNRSERGTENGSVRAPLFTGMALDRADRLRTDASWVASQLESPSARAVGASRDGVVLEGDAEPRLARRPLELAPAGEPLLLGLEDGAALFAIDLDGLDQAAEEAFVGAGRAMPLRDAGGVLPRSEGGLAAYLAALLNWHRKHHFCANCGALTVITQAGQSRSCPGCGSIHFPRTDPVVIMLVES
ncbi:MAG: hypothetical protein JO372_02910, partial [Solirubrobacterales bacterium]|nr:hypothetical protein [Solirubrobacterales bacterium]